MYNDKVLFCAIVFYCIAFYILNCFETCLFVKRKIKTIKKKKTLKLKPKFKMNSTFSLREADEGQHRYRDITFSFFTVSFYSVKL